MWRDRKYITLYGDIVGNANILSTTEDGKTYDLARNCLFHQLLELLWHYPREYDELERNPIHFKPSLLMDKACNSRENFEKLLSWRADKAVPVI